jgi:hypothetical protein
VTLVYWWHWCIGVLRVLQLWLLSLSICWHMHHPGAGVASHDVVFAAFCSSLGCVVADIVLMVLTEAADKPRCFVSLLVL